MAKGPRFRLKEKSKEEEQLKKLMEQISKTQQQKIDMNKENIDRMKDYTAPVDRVEINLTDLSEMTDLSVDLPNAVESIPNYIENKTDKLELKIQKSDIGTKQEKFNAAITDISTAKSELHQGPVTDEKNIELARLDTKQGYAHYLRSNIGAGSSLYLQRNPELKPAEDKYSQKLIDNIEDAIEQMNDARQGLDKVCESYGLTSSQVLNINKSNLIKILPHKKQEAHKKAQEKTQKQAVEQLLKAKQNYIEKKKDYEKARQELNKYVATPAPAQDIMEPLEHIEQQEQEVIGIKPISLEPLGTETSAYLDSSYASHQNNINKINIDKMIKFFSNKVNNKKIRHPKTFENAMKDINDLYVHLQPKVSPEQFAEKFVKDKKFRKEIRTLINEQFAKVKDKPKSRQYANVMLMALEFESAVANLTNSGINVDIKLSEGITDPIQTIV